MLDLASTIWRGVYDHQKRLKLWWTYIITERKRKSRWTFQDITMDGSKVYRMAAKGQEKEEECRQDRTTEARQAEDGENWKTRGLHFTSDVQMMLCVHVWIGCCIANGYSHPINRHVIPNCRKYWHAASFVGFRLDHMLHASKTLQDSRSRVPAGLL